MVSDSNNEALLTLFVAKTAEKDYQYFLTQGNFLKVVDTLEKFETNILDLNSPRARDFALFKRQLYAMYEVQNRSVSEHELFSFNIERTNLRWLSHANQEYINSLNRVDQLDQLADYKSLGKDEIFKRRALNPRRLKGVGALASSLYLYTYAPYLAVTFGPTAPVLGALATALYGLLSFSEKQVVNSIHIIKDGSDNHGRLRIKINETVLASSEIIVDTRDIKSVVALGNDDLGEDNQDGNVLYIGRYFDQATNAWVDTERALTLPGDAFRDRRFLEWVISEKSGEGEVADAYNDLLMQLNEQATKSGKISQVELLVARDQASLLQNSDSVAEIQINRNDPVVDKTLDHLKSIYGEEHLKTITDRELYSLYKQHSPSVAN